MKISELIKKLQYSLEIGGDVEVKVVMDAKESVTDIINIYPVLGYRHAWINYIVIEGK